MALFDEIHKSGETRDYPATIEDFVDFGLEPSDYVRYVGLQQRLQSELLLHNCAGDEGAAADDIESPEARQALDELVSFCSEINLCALPDHRKPSLCQINAEYSHDWLRYPKPEEDFRLAVERRLSCGWHEAEALFMDLFGAVFVVEDRYSGLLGTLSTESPIRVQRYNPDTELYDYLDSDEVRRMCDRAEEEQHKAEKELEEHLACKPKEHDTEAILNGYSWAKKLEELKIKTAAIKRILLVLEEAAETPDIYQFKDSDTLTVFLDKDACLRENHPLKPMKVKFAFHGKPDNVYAVEMCQHCKQFRIPLAVLTEIFGSYGVPKCNIVYEGYEGFSGADTASTLYNLGYAVRQSADLSAAERQNILKNAIDSGIVSKTGVLDFLRSRTTFNSLRAGLEPELGKWREDYEYIESLQD